MLLLRHCLYFVLSYLITGLYQYFWLAYLLTTEDYDYDYEYDIFYKS